MNRFIVFLIVASWLPKLSDAQIQIQQSIVSASGSTSGSNIQTSWSIGEIFTESFTNNSIKAVSGTNESGVVYVITGIDEIAEGYKLYPNPFSTNLILEAPNESLAQIGIQVFDPGGKIIPLEITTQPNQLTISPGEIAPGVYILTVQGKNKKQSFKIIKK